MGPIKLKVACAGLGRMGKRHALHFLNRTPRAELVAASSPDDTELQWAKLNLEPYGVRLYKDYDEMIKQEGLQAVVIASATTVHAEQAIKAIEADKHVLCEKPLSTSIEIVGGISALNWLFRQLHSHSANIYFLVPIRRRCREEEAPSQGYLRILSTFRCLLPRCLGENGCWSDWPPIRRP